MAKTVYPRVSYSLFKENGKIYVVKIHNPTEYKGQPKQIKRSTFEGEERAAKKRALEIIDSFFAEDSTEKVNQSMNTVSAMLDKYVETVYLENMKSRHSKEKQKTNISGSNSRRKFLHKYLGHLNPRSLNMDIINDYIRQRREDRKPNGQPYAEGTINIELNFLKAAVKVLDNGIRFQVKQNIAEHIELKQVEREVTLTDEQLETMIEKFAQVDRENRLATNFSLFLKTLYFCGIRWGQLHLLEFDEINFDPTVSRFEFPPEKTKHEKTKKHMVYINKRLLKMFRKISESRDIIHSECNCSKSKTCKIQKKPFVFCNNKRQCEPFSKDLFYQLWYDFCEDEGWISYNQYKKDGKDCKILPHDIRRTRIVRLIEMGWDRKFIMEQTGHKSHATFDKYNIVTPKKMNTIVNQFDDKERALRAQENKQMADFEQEYQDHLESIW